MKNLNPIFILTLLIFIISCNNHDSPNKELPFAGFYKIDRINSSESVDLNDDSKSSNDLKTEIDFSFENTLYDLEIRPHFATDSEAKLISFSLPEPYLSFECPNKPNGSIQYSKINFGFIFDHNNEFILIDKSLNTDFAFINELKILPNDQIKANILKKYYDFNVNDWRNLNIEIIYTKKDLQALVEH